MCSNVRIGEKAGIRDCEFGTGFEAKPGGEPMHAYEGSAEELMVCCSGAEGREVDSRTGGVREKIDISCIALSFQVSSGPKSPPRAWRGLSNLTLTSDRDRTLRARDDPADFLNCHNHHESCIRDQPPQAATDAATLASPLPTFTSFAIIAETLPSERPAAHSFTKSVNIFPEGRDQRGYYASSDAAPIAHLDGIKWSARTLWVELHAPDALTRFRSGDDALDGRVVAVDEEGCPAGREALRQAEGVLVVLRLRASKRVKIDPCSRRVKRTVT